MPGGNTKVFIELPLLAKIRSWDLDSQIEISVIQDLIREFGVDVISDIPSYCSVETLTVTNEGETKQLDFWIRLRGSWSFFSLVVRAEGAVVLRDHR